MSSLWIVVLSLAVLEISAQTSGQSQLLCQLNPKHCCVCWPNDLHGYCSTGRCAPNDYANECRTNPRFAAKHVLPDEWELMLDSFDYQNLIQDSNPVWTRNDADRDGRQFIQRGGICQYDLRACEYTQGPQDNWVFTQHIKYPPGIRTIGPTEIFVNTSYRFSQCTGNPACTNDFVTLYRFDTNGFEPNRRNDPANYVTPLFGLGTETTDSKLQQVGLSDTSIVRSFIISGTHTGFYLGIRDTGTCGQLKRILLYYTPSCKKLQDGLVNYPEVVRPPAGSGPYTAEACCAPNSRNTTTSRTIRAYSDGRCDRGVVCVCDPGYILDARGTGCIACPAGMYRSVSDPQTICLTCPMNTVNDMEAAPTCPCVDGYFRDEQTNEGPDVDCTSPPDPVLNLRTTVSQTRDTSVTVTWTRPETPGRSDFYYTIEYSDPDSFGNFLPADPRNTRYINSASTVTYRVPASGSGVSLRPDTDYTIRVTVHNGVSDQDSENEALRRRELQVRTKEGLPGVPVDVQLLAGVVVWGPPAQPNGAITGYDVRFSDLSRCNPIIPKEPSETFHIVVDGNIAGLSPSNTRVEIRARTSVGPGVWSSPEPSCQACPPVTCPTTATPEVCTDPTPPPGSGLQFMLNGRTYLNNTIVLMSDIGEGDNALLCMTDRTDCCVSPVGEFYHPDNTPVGFSITNPLYRNRGPQLIRLNRRNNDPTRAGRYRCEIPDSSGRTQNMYINIILKAPDDCEAPPTPTECPTTATSAPLECTCPYCPTCPTCVTPPEPTTCPPVTCPPTPPPCPTTLPPDPTAALKFMLNGRTYLNNTIVLMSDIGEGDDALLCMTDRTDCCNSPVGEFYYPDNRLVNFRGTGDPLYRSRGPQLIRLNRRNGVLSPTGRYRCEIPDSSGRLQNIYINIIAPSCSNSGEIFSICVTTCRPTCTNPSPSCSSTCQPGCTCPFGMVLNEELSRCVNPSECVTFELRGEQLSNCSTVKFSDIGEGNNGLIFRTDFTNCCKEQALGECYSPDGIVIPVRARRKAFYRNRDVKLLRLNRRPGTTTVPEGKYCCHVPVSESENKVVCANIVV